MAARDNNFAGWRRIQKNAYELEQNILEARLSRKWGSYDFEVKVSPRFLRPYVEKGICSNLAQFYNDQYTFLVPNNATQVIIVPENPRSILSDMLPEQADISQLFETNTRNPRRVNRGRH